MNATVLCAVCVGAVLAVNAVAHQAVAQRKSVVVTVNLAAVLQQLDQRAESEAELKKMTDHIVADDESRKAEINAMKDALSSITDDAAKKAKQDELALATLKYQGWVRYTADKVDIERALLLQDLYRSIKTAASQMAAQGGYDIVLVDDSTGELSTQSDSPLTREGQIRQQIASRQVLHSTSILDITGDLVVWMNNAYKNRGVGE